MEKNFFNIKTAVDRSMRCHLPWSQVFVSANGMVSPCCAPIDIGNVSDQGILEIFSNRHSQALRSDISAGRSTFNTRHCTDCYALKSFVASGYTFESAHSIGSNTDDSLARLESSYPEFVANYRTVREAYLTGSALPTGVRPLRLEIQFGEHCDIRCFMCWQDHASPKVLKREVLKEIEELLPYAQNVLITGGEPTIYKSFWELIDQFKKVANPEARLQILTHGQHLEANLVRFEGIQHVGFCINVDGPNRETYEKIRFGAKWDKLLASLQAVREAQRCHPGWGINMTFLLMKSNIELIEESIDLANAYGAQWSCGMISGEYQPVDQCRTYFNENIFRFGHLGYRTEDIVRLLEMATVKAATNGENAVACLKATVQQVRATPQIPIAPETAQELGHISDSNELSDCIRSIVVAATAVGLPTVHELELSVSSLATERGSGSAEHLAALLDWGRRLEEEGDFAAALPRFREALAGYRNYRHSNEDELATATFYLGRCLAALGSKEALTVLNDAWIFRGRLFGEATFRTAEVAFELGKALAKCNRYHDALIPLNAALKTFKLLFSAQDKSSYIAVSLDELGACYLALRRSEAEDCLNQAFLAYEAMWSADSSLAVGVAIKLVDVYTAGGREADAANVIARCPKAADMHCGRTEKNIYSRIYIRLLRFFSRTKLN